MPNPHNRHSEIEVAGKSLVELAQSAGLPIGSVPDTQELSKSPTIDLAKQIFDQANHRVLALSAGVVAAICDYAELDPENLDNIPQKWIDAYGLDRAKVYHRMAKCGWLNNKEAPTAVRTATLVYTGIIRSIAAKHAERPQAINVQVVNMPETTAKQHYPVQDVDDDGK